MDFSALWCILVNQNKNSPRDVKLVLENYNKTLCNKMQNTSFFVPENETLVFNVLKKKRQKYYTSIFFKN